MYPIEKDQKGPPPIGKFDHTKWPIDQLEIGDSFLVPPKEAHSVRVALSVKKLAMRNRGSDWNATTRTVEGGLRVWRTA